MIVISASYRTDIPAFYGEWFMQRVREGYVRYKNPYGPQVVTVSLKPEDVQAIVFWSKNYRPFLKYLPELDASGLDFYFHYTITGQPQSMEARVARPEETIESFKDLARRYSPQHIQWRYDPITFSSLTDAEFHLRTFESLAQKLAGYTHRCYFSFMDLYEKAKRNLKEQLPDVRVFDPPNDQKLLLAQQLANIAKQYEITMYTCAEDFAVGGLIQRGACVDQNILNLLWPHKARNLGLSKNRGGCGCYENRDIGAYDSCPHGCVYCYANLNQPLALKTYQQHDPGHDMLVKIDEKQPPKEGLAQLRLL